MDKQTTGIVFLILNLFIPGLGTVIWGNRTHGIIQLIMSIGYTVLATILTIVTLGLAAIILGPLGFIVWPAAWIWALISSLKFMGVMK